MERRQISICIPTYQRAEILKRTLSHLAEISNLDMEVVISDNASNDDTPEVARSFENRFMGFRYHRNRENRGQMENLHMAMSLATGVYSFMLHDDDQLIPEGMHAAIELLDKQPDLVAVYGGHQEWEPNGDKILATCRKVNAVKFYRTGETLKIINECPGFQFPVVRARLFQRFCFYDRYTVGTRRLVAKLLSLGGIAIVPQLFYKHAHTVPRSEYNLTEGYAHDNLRADYELFFAEMDLDFANADQLAGITQFIRSRCVPAYMQGVRFARLKGEYLTERNFLLRAKIYGLVGYDKLVAWEQKFLTVAVAERIQTILDCLPAIQKVIVEKKPVMGHIIKLLSEQMADEMPSVEELDSEAFIERDDHQDSFFLAERYELCKKRITRHQNVNPARQHALYDLISSLRLTRKPLNLRI